MKAFHIWLIEFSCDGERMFSNEWFHTRAECETFRKDYVARHIVDNPTRSVRFDQRNGGKRQ